MTTALVPVLITWNQPFHRALLACVLAGSLLLSTGQGAGAHPLGNFSVNRYSRIEVDHESIKLRYVLDLAEIPTLQELHGVEGGRLSGDTLRQFGDRKVAQLAAAAQLTVGGQLVTWELLDRSIELIPGQADLDTMRVELTLSASRRMTEGGRIAYQDTNYQGRVGWHEVVLRGVNGVALIDSTAPAWDQSDELRQYPSAPSRAPLDLSAATATISVNGSSAAADPAVAMKAGVPRLAPDPIPNALAAFLREGTGPRPFTLFLALLVAAGLGALHALEPGHGKALVGGYLVGSRGTPRHALVLGLTVTATHTVGVYALGLVTLVAAQYVLPERLYPVLGMLSGLLLVAVGVSLVRARLQEAFAPAHVHSAHPPTQEYEDGQVHEHGHQHGHRHQHDHDSTHRHVHDHAHVPGTHDHGHDYEQRVEHAQSHSHRGHAHSHELPGTDGNPVTMRSLLAMGVSGGLLPCPSALVVLLAAVSFQNVGLGLALVAAFSAGLAGVLTALGLAVVYGGRLVGRSPWASRVSRWPVVRAVPALSALAITMAGVAIAAQAARVFG